MTTRRALGRQCRHFSECWKSLARDHDGWLRTQSASDRSEGGKFPASREFCREFRRFEAISAIRSTRSRSDFNALQSKFPTRVSREFSWPSRESKLSQQGKSWAAPYTLQDAMKFGPVSQ
jgi:hypothetical protein